jgi:uncharacterized protein
MPASHGVGQGGGCRTDTYTLCGCTVAPGFDFLDFEMPPRDEMLRMFPLQAELVGRISRP